MIFTTLISLAFIALLTVQSSLIVEKSVNDYMHRMVSILGLNHYDALRKSMQLNEFMTLPSNTKLVIDTGRSSLKTTQIFNTITQLNISGINRFGKASVNCGDIVDKKLRMNFINLNPKLTQLKSHVYLSTWSTSYSSKWWNIVAAHPDRSFIVLNDDSQVDAEWYANRLDRACDEQVGRSVARDCLAPVPFTVRLAPKSSDLIAFKEALLLRNMNSSRAANISAAYRDFVASLVPARQLLRVDTQNDNRSPLEIWSEMTSFLGISLSNDTFSNLVGGGVVDRNVFNRPQQCTAVASATPCVTTGLSGAKVLHPSVCSQSAGVEEVSVDGEARIGAGHSLTACAVDYATSIAALFGEEYHSLILDRMTTKQVAKRFVPRSSTQLVLGVGPGTTGTTSLFTAMKMLNLTSYHYNIYAMHCASTSGKVLKKLFTNHLQVLSLHAPDAKVFWGDAPVPSQWWGLRQLYPEARLVMTEVDDEEVWFTKRLKEHCNRRMWKNWDSCTVPLAFEFPVASALSVSLYNASHMSRASRSQSRAAFAAYRTLLRCSVPPSHLLWLNMKQASRSPSVFWTDLTVFLNMSLPASTLSAFIRAGVPRVSRRAGCQVGSSRCTFKNNDVNSTMIPSVCLEMDTT